MPPSSLVSPAPTLTAGSRRRRRREPAGPSRNAPLLVAALAALALAGLAASGRADPAWSSALAAALLLVGAAGAGLGRRAATAEPGPSAPGVSPPSPHEAQTYALALELAPNPVLLVGAEEPDDIAGRRILFANAEARELLRIPREGALLVSAVRHPSVLEAIDEALFGRTPRVLTYEGGGEPDRSWRVWTKPLPPGERQPRLALVIMRDETDLRRNERARADFLANASHELRTPLASLTGFIETLRGHARDDADARERFLLIMSRQADRMARLIDDLLSLSRIELNEHVRPAGACDLAAVAGDVLDALAPQIAAKRVRVALDLPPAGAAEVVGDRDQIVQVVQNLLDNAVKYAPAEGVVGLSVVAGLSLEQAGASRPGDPRLLPGGAGGRMPLLTPVRQAHARYAALRIDDTGPGLAREHLPRLAERFYRVEGQKSGERMGTGLGLAIVKHIVNRHRGGFVVESAPGQGAAFVVYLPLTAAAANRRPPLAADEARERASHAA